MRVVFTRSQDIAANIKSFYFRAPARVRYIAGQFIELRIPHEGKDKRGDKRWYTLSSSPTEDLLCITTKFAPDKSSSFKTALKAMKPGTVVHMASPMGDFVLPKDPSIPLVFIAGGIGCTPFRSMIKYVTDMKETREVTLLYTASNPKEIAFKDVFDGLGKNFRQITGERLIADDILENAGNRPEQYIYISGPEPMIETLDKDLRKLGVNKKHIRTDFFPGYVAI